MTTASQESSLGMYQTQCQGLLEWSTVESPPHHEDGALCSFPVAVVTSYHKLGSLNTHNRSVLSHCGEQQSEIKVSAVSVLSPCVWWPPQIPTPLAYGPIILWSPFPSLLVFVISSHDLYLIVSGKTFFPNKVTLPSSRGKDLDISLVGPLFTPWWAVRHLSEALSQYTVERGAELRLSTGPVKGHHHILFWTFPSTL